MAARASKRRRNDAQERHREAFLQQVGQQLHELAALAPSDDTDAVVPGEIERVAETAETLGLGLLARASRQAVTEVSAGRRVDGFRRVAQALRRTRGARRIAPILVVADAASSRALVADAEVHAEPFKRYGTLEAFSSSLHTEEPAAVCLPAEALQVIQNIAEHERFPVIVHAEARDVDAISAAMLAGAVGFVERPVAPAELLRQVRWRQAHDVELVHLLLVMDEGPARSALQAALEAEGFTLHVERTAAALGLALDAEWPDAVILGAEVAGVSCGRLARYVRGHPRIGALPVMIVGKPKDPAGLRAAGIDDLMRDSADPAHIARRVRERVARFMRLPWGVDGRDGLPNRLGTLARLDAMLLAARRHSEPLTVGLLSLDGLATVDPMDQRLVHRDATLLAAQLFRRELRRTDLAGEIAPLQYLLGLPRTDAPTARPRLRALMGHLRDAMHQQPSLHALAPRLGAADTEFGLLGVAVRAEHDLT